MLLLGLGTKYCEDFDESQTAFNKRLFIMSPLFYAAGISGPFNVRSMTVCVSSTSANPPAKIVDFLGVQKQR